MDGGDVDLDGDIDIVVGQHNTSNSFTGRLIWYQNQNGGASWNTFLIDAGLEHHDGARLVDIDLDGDKDIVSIGWTHPWVALYINPAVGNTR